MLCKFSVRWQVLIWIVLLLLTTACSTPSPQPTAALPAATQAAQATVTLSPTVEASPTAEPPASGLTGGDKRITIAAAGDPGGLNPLYSTSRLAKSVYGLYLLPLWNVDADGNYVMELAEELPSRENGGISADGLTITIKLRAGVVWADGTPVTAQDAVFTYEMFVEPANRLPSRYPWKPYVQSVQALDENTVQIRLSQPYADWAHAFFTGGSRILPEHVYRPIFESQGTLDDVTWELMPGVGNGQFIMVDYQPGSQLVFFANPDYWRGRPKLDEIHVRIFNGLMAQYEALKSNEVHIGAFLTGVNLKALEESGKFTTQKIENGRLLLLIPNLDPATGHPALTDVTVRQALAYAIDREGINSGIFAGVYEIPGTFWHGSPYNNQLTDPVPYYPGKAIELLEAAGWMDTNGDGVREKDGVDLALDYVYASDDETAEWIATDIAVKLGEVGIKVTRIQYSPAGPPASGAFDLAQIEGGMDFFPAPDTGLFRCDQMPTAEQPEGFNRIGLCVPEIDDLLRLAAGEPNPELRVQQYQQLGRLLTEQAFIIPLRSDPDVWAVSTQLENVVFSGADPFMWAFEWDLAADAP